jgi:hypothetical protein
MMAPFFLGVTSQGINIVTLFQSLSNLKKYIASIKEKQQCLIMMQKHGLINNTDTKEFVSFSLKLT